MKIIYITIATPRRAKTNITKKIIPSSPKCIPRHPQRLGVLTGKGSEINANISPIKGVKIRLIRKVQPKPILRPLPNMPTRTARKQFDRSPKVINDSPIRGKLFSYLF